MTGKNRKRSPQLLGPRWRELAVAPNWAPEEVSFHASLRDCAETLVEHRSPRGHDSSSCSPMEEEPQPPLVEEPQPPLVEELQPPRANSSGRAWSWLRAKDNKSAAKQLHVVEPVSPENVLQICPKTSQPPQSGSKVLTHVWSWLHAKYTVSATKRLRVAEMVSLGEKRFVAVVSVEGQEFLIGGGATGVSLMTQLGTGRETANALRKELRVQGESE